MVLAYYGEPLISGVYFLLDGGTSDKSKGTKMDSEIRIDNMRLCLFVNQETILDCVIDQDHILQRSEVVLTSDGSMSLGEIRKVLLHVVNAIQYGILAKDTELLIQNQDYPNPTDQIDAPF